MMFLESQSIQASCLIFIVTLRVSSAAAITVATEHIAGANSTKTITPTQWCTIGTYVFKASVFRITIWYQSNRILTTFSIGWVYLRECYENENDSRYIDTILNHFRDFFLMITRSFIKFKIGIDAKLWLLCQMTLWKLFMIQCYWNSCSMKEVCSQSSHSSIQIMKIVRIDYSEPLYLSFCNLILRLKISRAMLNFSGSKLKSNFYEQINTNMLFFVFILWF